MILSVFLLICNCLTMVVVIDEVPDYTEKYENAENEIQLYYETKNNIVDLETYIEKLHIQLKYADGYKIKVVDKTKKTNQNNISNNF